MRRSGTSALTGALDRLGIQFESDYDRLKDGPGAHLANQKSATRK